MNNFRRLALSDGTVIRELDVPVKVVIQEKHLMELPDAADAFEDGLDGALAEIKEEILEAVADTYARVVEGADVECEAEEVENIDKELN